MNLSALLVAPDINYGVARSIPSNHCVSRFDLWLRDAESVHRYVTIWTCSSPLDLARGPRAYMTSSARPRDVITATRTTHNDHAILPACSTTPRDALPSRAASRARYCGPRDPAKLRPRVLGFATRPLATSRTADRTRHPLSPISTATRTLCGSTLVQTQVLAD